MTDSNENQSSTENKETEIPETAVNKVNEIESEIEVKNHSVEENATDQEPEIPTTLIPSGEKNTPKLGFDDEDTSYYRFKEPQKLNNNEPEIKITKPKKVVQAPVKESKKLEEYTETRRGTIDLGLLLLRVSVGVIMLFTSLKLLTGWWNGMGIHGFSQYLASIGFTNSGTILSWMIAIVGTLTGLMLIFGVVTPFACAIQLMIQSIIIAGIMVTDGHINLIQNFGNSTSKLEYPLLIFILLFVITLVGPGVISADYYRKWSTRPFIGSLLSGFGGVALAVVVWVLLNHNQLVSIFTN